MSAGSYSAFKLEDVTETFDVEVRFVADLFVKVAEQKVSQRLLDELSRNIPLAFSMGSEKAKSELLVMPVLLELYDISNPKFSFFSGLKFEVEPKLGLRGVCDFIISRSSNQAFLTAPVIALVEAKRDDFEKGLPQCVAEMIAAQIFNERKNQDIETIYGVITNGSSWRFLRLQGKLIEVNTEDYPIQNVEKIIGILQYMSVN